LPKTDRSRWLILALIVLAQLMVVLDTTIVNIVRVSKTTVRLENEPFVGVNQSF